MKMDEKISAVKRVQKRIRGISQVNSRLMRMTLGIALIGGMLLVLLILFSSSSSALYVSYVGNSEVQLYWYEDSDEENFVRYELFRDGTKIKTTTGRMDTDYKDTGLLKGSSYDYRLDYYQKNETGHTNLEGSIWANDSVTGDVQGTPIFNTAWTQADGPYELADDIEAGDGVFLVIGEGTVIYSVGHSIEGIRPELENITLYGSGLVFEDLSSLSIRNCTIDRNSDEDVIIIYPGIDIMNCSNIEISGNRIGNFHPNAPPRSYVGIWLADGYYRPSRDIRISDNVFQNCYCGIYTYIVEDLTIESNTFIDNYMSTECKLVTGTNGFWNNEVRRVSGDLDDVRGLEFGGDNVTFQGNEFWDLLRCININGDNSFIENNTIFDCKNGIYVDGSDHRVWDNQLEGLGYQGYGIWFQGDGFHAKMNNIQKLGKFGRGGIEISGTNATVENNEIRDGDTGIEVGGQYILIRNNRIRNNTEHGILMSACSNSTIENNTIFDNPGDVYENYGIQVLSNCERNTIRDNYIHSVVEAGIYFGDFYSIEGGDNHWNTVENNTIFGPKIGIGLDGHLVERWKTFSSADNNTIVRNTIRECDTGIYLKGGNNNTIIKNDISDEGNGIRITYEYWSAEKMAFLSSNNVIKWNEIGSGISEFVMPNASTNQYIENNFGTLWPVNITFLGHTDDISIRGVKEAPPMPLPPDYSIRAMNISNYVYVHYWSDPFEFTFHYEDDQIGELDESLLGVWRYDSHEPPHPNGLWIEDRNQTIWKKGQSSNATNNEISVTIGNLSIGEAYVYAPMIPVWVVNVNSGKYYHTIQDAIDDPDTKDGQVILVYPEYTMRGIKENLVVDKEIGITSFSGFPMNNVIQAADTTDHTIYIMADNVDINGFTIIGGMGTDTAGVYISNSAKKCSISLCTIRNNSNGIFASMLAFGILELEYVQVYDNTFDGLNASTIGGGGFLYVNGSGNEFRNNGMHGIVTKNFDIGIKGGTVIHDNGGWGIRCHGWVVIVDGAMQTINNNFMGGIFGLYIGLPRNFEIANNGGVGLLMVGLDITPGAVPLVNLTLEGISVIDNKGNGIEVWYTNLVIEGTGSEIRGNHGHGIFGYMEESSIVIKGKTKIHDNHEYGIRTLGNLSISDGAMDFVIDNKKGGIFGNVLELPSGLEISGNGGPGITCLGDISGSVDECSTSTLTLKNVYIHDNKGHGIVTYDCNLRFEGLPFVIDNNEGHGIFTNIGPSSITIKALGSKITNNDEWGIFTEGYVDINVATQIDANGKGGIMINGSCRFSFINDSSISGNGGPGLHLINIPCAVINNVITGNTDGLLLESGTEGTFEWNIIRNNTRSGLDNLDSTTVVDAGNNFWGHSSGPSGIGPGTGDAVNGLVLYTPWTGAGTSDLKQETVQPGTGTMDSKPSSDTEVDYDTTSETTITTQQYLSNPGDGFNGEIGKYVDVQLDSAEGVNEITIKLFYTDADLGGKDESSLKLSWWDGSMWQKTSDTGVETSGTGGYSGYIWAKVRSDTSPALTDMSGTPFGATDDTGDGEEEEDDDGFPVGAALLGIIVILLIAGIGFYLMTEQSGTGDIEGKGKSVQKGINEKSGSLSDDHDDASTNDETGNEEGEGVNDPSPEEMNKKEISEKLAPSSGEEGHGGGADDGGGDTTNDDSGNTGSEGGDEQQTPT